MKIEMSENKTHEITEPSNLGDWNWGAFLFGAWWGLFNGIYWPFVLAVILTATQYIVPQEWKSIIVIASYIIGGFISLGLGIFGREMAWKHRKWKSAEQFNKVQRGWSIAGIIPIIICLVILGISVKSS